jgi:transposase-like protein
MTRAARPAQEFANSRNGTTPKTAQTEVGPVALDRPRDQQSSFEARLVPKGTRRLAGGLDVMIISLFAGGMTVRDIEHHLQRALGVELSRETISNITDTVAEEVKAGRPGRWTRSTRSSTSTGWW